MPCMQSLFSRVWLFATLWTVARQAPLSMGILQARILEWVAVSSSRGSSIPGIEPHLLQSLHCWWILYRWTKSQPNPPSSASRGHRSVLGQNRLDLFVGLLFPLLSLPCLPLTSSSADVTVSHSQFLWLVSAKAYLCSLSPLILEVDISCSLEIRSCLLLTIQLASMEMEVRPFCTVKVPPKQSPVDMESSRPHPTPAHQNLHFNKVSSDAVCISV